MIPANRNPAYNPVINPARNPVINPNRNPAINPARNPIINPYKNVNINPDRNPVINPFRNPTINPNRNPALNSNRNPVINPVRNPVIDPNKNPNIEGKYIILHQEEGYNYTVIVNDKVSLVYARNYDFLGFSVKSNENVHNFFDSKFEWAGMWLHNNVYSKDMKWVGHLV